MPDRLSTYGTSLQVIPHAEDLSSTPSLVKCLKESLCRERIYLNNFNHPNPRCNSPLDPNEIFDFGFMPPLIVENLVVCLTPNDVMITYLELTTK